MSTLQSDLCNFPRGDTLKLYNFSASHSGEKPNRNLPVFWQDLRANIQGNNPESQPSKGYLALGTPKNFLRVPKPFYPHLCRSAGQLGRFLTQLHLSSPKLQSPGSSAYRPVSSPERRSLPD